MGFAYFLYRRPKNGITTKIRFPRNKNTTVRVPLFCFSVPPGSESDAWVSTDTPLSDLSEATDVAVLRLAQEFCTLCTGQKWKHD
jgi:hypothetical protein